MEHYIGSDNDNRTKWHLFTENNSSLAVCGRTSAHSYGWTKLTKEDDKLFFHSPVAEKYEYNKGDICQNCLKKI